MRVLDWLTRRTRLPVTEWPEVRVRIDRQRAAERRLEEIERAMGALRTQTDVDSLSNHHGRGLEEGG